MSLFAETWLWLTDPDSWGPGGIGSRLAEHIAVTACVVAIAALIALPLGIGVGHRRSGGGWVIAAAGGARSIPTLGVLTVFALWLGIGLAAPMVALVLLALPPLLAGAYSGIAAIDRVIPEAARSIGMSEAQIIATVEMPIAARTILGGLRSATLQVVSTATLAAYTSDTGLGRYIISGLKSRDYVEMIGGSALVVALALLLDAVFVLSLGLLGSRRSRPQLKGNQPDDQDSRARSRSIGRDTRPQRLRYERFARR